MTSNDGTVGQIPRAELLNEIVISFRSALLEFTQQWHCHWYNLSAERACAAKVAGHLENKYSPQLKIWCEINRNYIYEKYKYQKKVRGQVDIAILDQSTNNVIALIEFKTSQSVQSDMDKLQSMQNDLPIQLIICVGCSQSATVPMYNDQAEKCLKENSHKNTQSIKEKHWCFQETQQIALNKADGKIVLISPFITWHEPISEPVNDIG